MIRQFLLNKKQKLTDQSDSLQILSLPEMLGASKKLHMEIYSSLKLTKESKLLLWISPRLLSASTCTVLVYGFL